MNQVPEFRLSGIALPKDANDMLHEMCEHFVEHAEVKRNGNIARMKNELGVADIDISDGRMLIELNCLSAEALQRSRNILAEHLFYFAGEDPFELTWSEPAPKGPMPNIHHVTVARVEDVTPHMRRVVVSCDDVTPFIEGGMHVRILVPPKGRPPVWPGLKDDGRVAWPTGEDEILVRVYTIRSIDAERREMSLDFLQHPAEGVKTPGADFARDAQPGDRFALVGPGGGDVPEADTILMIGDEAALPAIARIAAEVPEGTKIKAIIEVDNPEEEQALFSKGLLEVRWLHRRDYPADATGIIADEARKAIEQTEDGTYVWIACEKEDVRGLRTFLKKRGHDRKKMYVAWYWEKNPES